MAIVALVLAYACFGRHAFGASHALWLSGLWRRIWPLAAIFTGIAVLFALALLIPEIAVPVQVD